jgi:predicted ATP-dependent protease
VSRTPSSISSGHASAAGPGRREGYLAERMRDEILLDQIMIDTEGECIGQINALSVIESSDIINACMIIMPLA